MFYSIGYLSLEVCATACSRFDFEKTAEDIRDSRRYGSVSDVTRHQQTRLLQLSSGQSSDVDSRTCTAC